MPSVPVRKPEIGRPGTNGASTGSAPWNASRLVPAGSSKRIAAVTPRKRAMAAGTRATGVLASSRRPARASSAAPFSTSQPKTFSAVSSEETTMRCFRSSMRNFSADFVRSTSCRPKNFVPYSAQSSILSDRRPAYPNALRVMDASSCRDPRPNISGPAKHTRAALGAPTC